MIGFFRRSILTCTLLCIAGNTSIGQTTSDYNRGMTCFREGRLQEARPLFEAAARRTPDSADVWKALGLTLLRLNDYAVAVDPMRRACELRAAGDDACYLEGRILFLLARYDESIAPLEKARNAAPPNPPREDLARIDRALALSWNKLGNAAEAERRFISAMNNYRANAQTRPDPTGQDPRIDYGAFLVRQGRAGEAIKPLALALAANPESFAANLESGRAFLDLDRAADALPYLERATAIDPASPTAQMLLGKTLLRAGRAEEGERILSQARKRWDAANQGSSSVK